MYVLVLKHAPSEGPGTLGSFLESHGVDLATVNLCDGMPLPSAHRGAAAVLVLGGPMSANDDEQYPYLTEECRFLRETARSGIPVLGICLGAQLLARAFGGRVAKAPREEVGFSRVRVTPDGESDALFAGLGRELEVFQWHADTFSLPDSAALLAAGENCRNQAFRVGGPAYGLQFHVEVTRNMVADWLADREERTKALDDFDASALRLASAAKTMYLNFLGMAARA
jgi:GMP synthase-like glutamine amidotransferase